MKSLGGLTCVTLLTYLLSAVFSVPLPSNNRFFISEGTIPLKVETPMRGLKDLKVDSRGNIWVVDALQRIVLKFGADGSLIRTIDRFASERFIRPLGLFVDKQNNVYVADAGKKSIYVFTNAGEALRSMQVKHDLQTLQINSRGEFIIAGFNGEKFPQKGFYLNRYDRAFNFIRAFEPVDEKLDKLNLSYFDGVYFDTDENDNIYCVQPVTYRVKKYNREGRLLQVIAGQNRYYHPPRYLPEETFRDRDKFSVWLQSWTPIAALQVTRKGFVIVQFMQRRGRFWIDIYKPNGKPLYREVLVEYPLLGRDQDDKFYFLISKDPYILGKFRLRLGSHDP